MGAREFERIQAVNRMLNLETSKTKELETILSLAAEICETASAAINLIDDKTQYIKFKTGLELDSTLREDAFCNHVIDDYKVLMVPDMSKDKRFENNYLVKAENGVRFYAGAPLTTHDGHNLGALCVVDGQPKTLNEMQLKMLHVLSREVIQILEFDASISVLREQFLSASNAEVKMRSFFESSSAIYLLLDKEYRIMAFNQTVKDTIQRIFKVTLVRGMDIQPFIGDSNWLNFTGSCDQAFAGEMLRKEEPLVFDQDFFYCDVTYDPARNMEGEIIGVSYNSIDITERHRNKVAALKSQGLLDKIAYIQSHELRKPVANIKGLLQLLELDNHYETIPELIKMRNAADQLDETISLIVNYTAQSIRKIAS